MEQVPGVFLRQNLSWEEMCAEPGCNVRENQVGAGEVRVRVRKRRKGAQLPLVQEEEKEEDHEARTESLILQRGSMRHLADWFYPDGGWGWRVVIAAALIQLLAIGPVLGGGQVLIVSKFRPEFPFLHQVLSLLLSSRYASTPALSALLPALGFASSQLVAPLAASLVARFSPRLPATIGGLLTGLGWLFTSFSMRQHQVVISLTLFLGPGLALLNTATTTMLAQYFRKRRPLAESLVSASQGISVASASLLLHRLASHHGWHHSLQAIAALSSLSALLALTYRPAALYHPQRPAILHLQMHMRVLKLQPKRRRQSPSLICMLRLPTDLLFVCLFLLYAVQVANRPTSTCLLSHCHPSPPSLLPARTCSSPSPHS